MAPLGVGLIAGSILVLFRSLSGNSSTQELPSTATQVSRGATLDAPLTPTQSTALSPAAFAAPPASRVITLAPKTLAPKTLRPEAVAATPSLPVAFKTAAASEAAAGGTMKIAASPKPVAAPASAAATGGTMKIVATPASEAAGGTVKFFSAAASEAETARKGQLETLGDAFGQFLGSRQWGLPGVGDVVLPESFQQVCISYFS